MHQLSLEHGVSVDELERTNTPDQLQLYLHWMVRREERRAQWLAAAVRGAFAGDA